MSECPYCQNTFEMQDTCSDEFRMWQGLQGPYYIPTVDAAGVLSWTNTGGLPNPDAVDISGPPGKGLTIKGVVATVGDLPANPEEGDTYLVGATDPYDGYIWLNGTWVELGDISKGETGEGVPTGGTTGQVLKKASNVDYDTEWGIALDPATSAPLMDGTAAVGTSTKYAREDHVHPVYDQIVRPNLLDNWYFVGGGSQQGGGQFPINQRGQTSYSSYGYTIDRWISEGMSVAVGSSSITITNNTAWSIWFTSVHQNVPQNITLTGSVIVTAYSGTVLFAMQQRSGSQNVFSKTVSQTGLLTGSGQATTSNQYNFGFYMTSGSSITVTACKLELGTTQTLAHQENGVWVLNEIPNFADELARCQRYFIRLGMTAWARYGVGVAESATNVSVVVNLPVTMASSPRASYSGDIRVGGNAISSMSQYPQYNTNGVTIDIVSSGLTSGNFYMMRNYNDASAYVDISADL